MAVTNLKEGRVILAYSSRRYSLSWRQIWFSVTTVKKQGTDRMGCWVVNAQGLPWWLTSSSKVLPPKGSTNLSKRHCHHPESKCSNTWDNEGCFTSKPQRIYALSASLNGSNWYACFRVRDTSFRTLGGCVFLWDRISRGSLDQPSTLYPPGSAGIIGMYHHAWPRVYFW